MARHQLLIAPAARDDLRDIYQYGRRHWGKTRSDSYLAAIKNQFLSLIEQPMMGVKRPELVAETRSLVIQSHTLFYRVSATQVEIIRILHGRQDPQHHL